MKEVCKLAHLKGCKVLFEPVSVGKAGRAKNVLHYLECITPNIDELVSLACGLASSGSNHFEKRGADLPKTSLCHSFVKLLPCIQLVLEQGTRFVVLTGGVDGAAVFELDESRTEMFCWYCPSLEISIVNSSGAGDCLAAGFLSGLLSKLSPRDCLLLGMATAIETLQSPDNVPISICTERLRRSQTSLATKAVFSQFKVPCSCSDCIRTVTESFDHINHSSDSIV